MRAPLLSPPCPWCGKSVDLSACTTRGWVRGRLETHLYVGGLGQPRAAVCPEKFSAYFGGRKDLPGIGSLPEVKDSFVERPEQEATWITDSIRMWRRKSPNCALLSERELLRRQRRAGRQQARRWKALGAKNQSKYDKMVGGEKAAHLRWHVKRGIVSKSCSFCNHPLR